MNPDLRKLIGEYLVAVSERVSQLQSELEIDLPSSNSAWATNGLKKRGILSDGASYLKHGHGCLIDAGEDSVDFDFGDYGEIDGFDACRLAEFVEVSPGRFRTSEERELKRELMHAEAAGDIECRGRLYYINKRSNRVGGGN